MTKMSDNLSPYLTLVEQGSNPATPGATHQLLYAKSGGIYVINSAAAVTGPFGTSGGGGLVGASYQRSAGSYTTTSGTLTPVDATNMNFTLTTGAHHVMCGLAGVISTSGTGTYVVFDVKVDGVALGPTYGLQTVWSALASTLYPAGFVLMTPVLSAGSHTFELCWWVNTGTATLHGASGAEAECQFWVAEQAW